MSYFDGVRVGDEVFVVGLGKCIVHRIGSEGYPLFIAPYNCSSYRYRQYNYAGIRFEEELQSAFWSDPQIVAPPRPKRMKKVNVEVRPFKSRQPNRRIILEDDPQALQCSGSGSSHYCGPLQTIEVEIEDD